MAAKTLSANNVSDVLLERCWISSVRCSWALGNFTPGVGMGPILVGVCHSDYQNNEIEEFIENVQSWNRGDQIAQEKNRRKVRLVGIFRNPDAVDDSAWLNDGKLITTKCGWILLNGQTVKVWMYNTGTQTLTTAPLLVVRGHANLWPQ